MHVAEAHAFARQAHGVGHLHLRFRIVDGQVAPAQIIGQNVDDVGPSGGREQRPHPECGNKRGEECSTAHETSL